MAIVEVMTAEVKLMPRRLMTMEYQVPGLGYIPLLKGKVKHLITWGSTSQNMSDVVGADREHAVERTRQAMETIGMASLSRAMRIIPNRPTDNNILEVTSEMFIHQTQNSRELTTFSNFIYTTDPSLALIVKPADCTVSIIHGVLPEGKPVVGLLHGGRDQVDALLPQQAIQHLVALGCEPEAITIGVAPSAKEYFMTNDTLYKLQNLKQWGEKGFLKEDGDRHITYLDIQGFLLDQYSQAGVKPQNIQVYDIDTQQAAEGDNPEGFSHSYAFYAKDPSKDGRFLVAAQLEED